METGTKAFSSIPLTALQGKGVRNAYWLPMYPVLVEIVYMNDGKPFQVNLILHDGSNYIIKTDL